MTASRSDLINRTVAGKVKELSHKTFLQRVDFLREMVGMNVKIDDADRAAVEHQAELRHGFIHDQSIFAIELNHDGQLESKRIRCIRHPRQVECSDVDKARDVYCRIAGQIYRSIVCDVLKCEEHRHVRVIRDLFERPLRKVAEFDPFERTLATVLTDLPQFERVPAKKRPNANGVTA